MKVSVAPMMDWTDRHCRYFHRLLSKDVVLYTEMVVADAVIHGDRDYLLGYDEVEHPVVLQIGGSDPKKMAEAARIGADYGYDAVNINVGCPSDRVQSGRFGACLMGEPETVARCYEAMRAAVNIPVTVKCRLGIDDQPVEDTLPKFLEIVQNSGCDHVIIHARKAWLQGLSPKENRTVPPLDYALVRQMKVQFPNLHIGLNGGLTSLEQGIEEMEGLDEIMFGRAAYNDPWILTGVDDVVRGEVTDKLDRFSVIEALIDYAISYETDYAERPPRALVRHIMGLFANQPGARLWRRTLSETSAKGYKPSEAIRAAANTRLNHKAA